MLLLREIDWRSIANRLQPKQPDERQKYPQYRDFEGIVSEEED